MQTTNIIKGTMIAASFTLLMMAANMANAKEMVTIPSLKAPIKKGEIITSSMITSLEKAAKQITNSIVVDADDIIGMESTRFIRAGYPLRKKQFRIAPTVKKGHMATVTFKKSGIMLTTEGTVMNDATAGDFVKVMNHNSKRLLRGIVQENGTIAVN